MTDDLTVVCADCGAKWRAIEDKPTPCYAQGHNHSLNGIPLIRLPVLDSALGGRSLGRDTMSTDPVGVVQDALRHETTLHLSPESFYTPSPGQLLDHVNHRVARLAVDALRSAGLLP